MGGGASKIPNLVVRAISALVVAPLALAMIWVGDWPFAVFVTVGGLLVLYEWRGITKISNFSYLASAVSLVVSAIFSATGYFLLALVVVVVVAAILFFVSGGRQRSQNIWSGLGALYTAAPVTALILLRAENETGFYAVAFVMIVVWVTDIAAYGAGRTIGGAKLWPSVSPNKTWAGLIGGAAGAAIVAGVGSMFIPSGNVFALALLGAFLAVVSQGGDLAESALKRHFGVKDSGVMFPGHGGILDRVDGLIAAAIVAAAIGILLSGFDQAAFGLLFWR